MELELSPEHARVQAAARRIAEAELRPLAAAADREGLWPEAQVRALAAEGFMAMLVPEEYGGSALGSVAYALAITEVARCCAATAVTMAVTNMVADAICAFGSEAQKQRYVPRLATGELRAGAFALSETAAGSDAASLKTVASRRGDPYVLRGSKCWITSGDRAGVLLVMAKTDPGARASGISAFLVEPSMPGFSVGRHEEKMGLRASSTVSINLDDLEVPEENRVGPEGIGFKIAMRALDGGRIGVASQALGIGLAALEGALDAAGRTSPEGGKVSDAQAVQWRLADIATALDAARLLILRAAALKDRGAPFSREASMAKLFSTEAANRAALEAVQIAGAGGCTGPLERHLRDVRVTTIYEGTSEVQRIVIARSVLAAP